MLVILRGLACPELRECSTDPSFLEAELVRRFDSVLDCGRPLRWERILPDRAGFTSC
jgi:hypothetical protein